MKSGNCFMTREACFRGVKTILFAPLLVIFSALVIVAIVIAADPSPAVPAGREHCRINKKEPGGEKELAVSSAIWEFMKTRNPATDVIPACIRGKELKYASRLPSAGSSRGPAGWASLGPFNFSGRILSMAIDADDDNVMLAAAASGGIWRTGDGGATWIKTTSPSDFQGATCVIQDLRPGKRNIWYHGTGELLSTTDRRLSIIARTVGLGDGIYKSLDGGRNWNQIPSTATHSPGTLNEVFQGIWNLAIDTSNLVQDEIYAACYGGIMRSTDAGDHWTMTLGHLTFKPFSTDVALGPGGRIYAALSAYCPEYPGNPSPIAGIWTSPDGISWENITPSGFSDHARTVRLRLAPSNPGVLYVLTEEPIIDADPTFGFSASQHTFWRYTGNGKGKGSWEDRTINLPGRGRGNILSAFLDTIHGAYNSIGGYALTFMVHPDNENNIFIGGTNLYRNTAGFADSLFTHWLGGYPYDYTDSNLHPDQHWIVASTSDQNVMFVCDDGGIYKTNDCFAPHVAWDHISLGVDNSQVYWVGLDHASSGDEFAIAGIQDNAIYITDRNLFADGEWETVMGGDGLTSLVADNKEYLIGSVYGGNIFTFQIDTAFNPINLISQRPTFFSDSDFLFYTNFALDPNDNKTFYFPQKNHLWRKSDMAAAAGDTNLIDVGWNELTGNLLGYQDFVLAVSVSKTPANRVYFGTYSGKVFRMDQANTGNPTPVEITGPGFPVNGFVACIDVDQEDGDKCFVVFSNYGVQSIFYTTDKGATWQAVGGNLEENPDGTGSGPSVRWVKSLKYQGSTVYYAGTSVGLFSTAGINGAQTEWLQESPDKIGRSIVDMIDARSADGLVMVATQGNGVFYSYFTPNGIGESAARPDFPKLGQNIPNPAGIETRISFETAVAGRVHLILYDREGKQIRVLLDRQMQKGMHTVTVSTSHLAPGVYCYSLVSSGGTLSRKMVVVNN